MTGKLVIVEIDISVLQFDNEVWQKVLVIPVLFDFGSDLRLRSSMIN